MTRLQTQINELFDTVKNDANHHVKIHTPKLYGLSGDAFVKAYVEATISQKAGLTDNFCSLCYCEIRKQGSKAKTTTIERYMRARFARDYSWIKRNEL